MKRKYKIKEIFGPTVQGEGSWVGMICIFVRFSGCNRWSGRDVDKEKSICSFCDTDFFDGEFLNLNEIENKILEISKEIKKIVLTGGEPTLQLDKEFCEYFFEKGYELHLETNGSKKIDDYKKFLFHVAMSPKQEFEKTKLDFANDLKILYPFISEKINLECFKNFNCENVFIQPQYGYSVDEIIKKFSGEKNIKLSLQVHKLLGLK